MHKEAMELNEIIKKESPLIYGLLSETGKKTYFSKTSVGSCIVFLLHKYLNHRDVIL